MSFDRRTIPADAHIAMVPARDGWPLRTYVQPARGVRRGAILWLGGRGDIFEKYLECFDEWTRAGWSIESFDWRGQGGSGRLGRNPRVGHADDFAPWIDDLAAFYEDWAAREAGPHVVMGHSMGGHLLLRALAEKRITPDRVVLSAPMLGFDTGLLPFDLAKLIATILARLTSGNRPAWNENERPGPPDASRQNYLTHDEARYGDEVFWKETDNVSLTLGPPSWGWLGASYRSIAGLLKAGSVEHIAIPVLIVGTDGDKLVSPAAIRTFSGRLAHAELIMLGKDVAHEVLRERDAPRTQLMAAIAKFLETAK
jgi:lysophospholipase